MQVGVLGATEVSLGGTPVDLGTRKQRALLAALALHRGRPVAVDTLVDLLWADRPPATVAGTLQAYVAGLRRALEPDRPPRAPAGVLVTVSPGYALRVPPEALDVARFEAAVSQGHRVVAPLTARYVVPTAGAGSGTGPGSTASNRELTCTVAELDEALTLWRGTPFLELDDAPSAVAERVRLEELRLVALEDKAAAALALGAHATVAAELETLTSAFPLRERLWALRVVALVRSGRQAEALEVLREVRVLLAEELGLEPGAELRDLQTAVLRQDPALDFVPLPAGDRTPAVSPGEPATTGRPAEAGHPRAAPPRSWPLLGRERELHLLTGLLDAADAGTPAFAALVGEPGIGKSRLAEELAALASARGALVLVGRCSQDEGAPPLWPWASVLAGLGRDLPLEAGTEDESTRFRSWDHICATLLEASAERTVLVVLDDLHWADVSSLRVLGLLLEVARDGRLAVVTTWRDRPGPTGALAAVADGLARRHAVRLHLTGLGRQEVAEMVAAVAVAPPSPDQAAELRVRTDGNPFFVVEYARLAQDRGDLSALLLEARPPAAVQDVLNRRVERLPEQAVSLLRTASVAGRDFDLPTLAGATGLDEDTVLDLLDPALSAGLVLDVGDDRFRFAHALVRDTVFAALSPSRRTRTHRLLAETLEGRPGRETEVARHWLASGPAYADRAWRAACTAAEQARLVYAYDEAEELQRRAVRLLDDDPGASTLDEYDVLMGLATTLRLAGKWLDLREVVHRLIEIAEWVDDVELLAQAAVLPSNGALWQAAEHGASDARTVQALRRVLAELPPQDSPLRCRAMLALASEVYYLVSAKEREALVEEGLAMARRLADPGLRLVACQIGFVSIWRAATADTRLRLADEAISLARELGDGSALTAAMTFRAVVASELGDVRTMESLAAEARRRAERHRELYSLAVLDSLEVAWLAMRGDWEGSERMVEHLRVTGEKMALAQYTDALAGAVLSVGVWQERYDDIVPLMLSRMEESRLPVGPVLVTILVRAGRLDEARDHLREHPFVLTDDNWFSMLPWCLAAEVALGVGDRDLARTSYDLLAPYAGRSCSAGSGVASGPVDAFLALAAAATGERGLASSHAEAALELCRTWRIPLVAKWLRDQRDRHGF